MSKSNVPFVNEVEEFNATMGKPNNYEPTIPEKKEWQFVYDFILEELEEYKHACETGDIVEVLDALCDIAYVSLGNGTMLHGLKDVFPQAYAEVQASNMSKACKTEEDPLINVDLFSENEQFKIVVSDNGIGIEDSLKDLVFEPKFTTKSSGMGLGLPMIKNIIEAYQGSISFTSKKDTGTIFTVILPKE